MMHASFTRRRSWWILLVPEERKGLHVRVPTPYDLVDVHISTGLACIQSCNRLYETPELTHPTTNAAKKWYSVLGRTLTPSHELACPVYIRTFVCKLISLSIKWLFYEVINNCNNFDCAADWFDKPWVWLGIVTPSVCLISSWMLNIWRAL